MRRGTQLLSRSLSAAIMTRAASRYRRTTSSAPVGLAPDPRVTPEAVVQAYGARCSGWLGYFGVHTWIAVKPSGARAYTIYEVLDWRLRRSGSAVAIRKRAPDARWAGNAPEILANKRGDGVDRSEEHTSELQSRLHLVCRLLLEKKKKEIEATTQRSERLVQTTCPK